MEFINEEKVNKFARDAAAAQLEAFKSATELSISAFSQLSDMGLNLVSSAVSGYSRVIGNGKVSGEDVVALQKDGVSISKKAFSDLFDASLSHSAKSSEISGAYVKSFSEAAAKALA